MMHFPTTLDVYNMYCWSTAPCVLLSISHSLMSHLHAILLCIRSFLCFFGGNPRFPNDPPGPKDHLIPFQLFLFGIRGKYYVDHDGQAGLDPGQTSTVTVREFSVLYKRPSTVKVFSFPKS
jgi:hypothetical protein